MKGFNVVNAVNLEQTEQGYNVFKMNESDVVAAPSMFEAIKWYHEDPECSIGPDLNTLNIDEQVQYVENPDSDIQSTTYRELIQKAIKENISFPCIIATYDW